MDSIRRWLDGCSPDSVTLDFVTPTRIVRLDRVLAGDDFQFEPFMRAIFRRASMLASLFCDSEWELDYGSLLEKARAVRTHGGEGQRMVWWQRHSSRQDRT